MARVNSLEKARKKQSKRLLIKRLFTVIVLVVVIAVVYLHRIEIATLGLMAWVEESISEQLSTNVFPVELPKSNQKQLIPLGPRVGVVQDSGVSVYNSVGEWMYDLRTAYQHPKAASSSKRLALYDIGAYSLRQIAGDKVVYERTFDHPISAVKLSEGHKMAVSTGETRFLSKVIVFSKELNELFAWSSSELYVTAMALSDRSLATAGVKTKGGMLCSDITLLSLKSDVPKYIVPLEDEMVYHLELIGDDTLLVLTNQSALRIGASGKIEAKTPLAPHLGAFAIGRGGELWVVSGDYVSSRRTELMKYGEDLKVKQTIPLEYPVKSLLTYKDGVVVFGGDYARLYDSELNLINTISTPDAITAMISGSHLYYATQSSLNRVSLGA